MFIRFDEFKTKVLIEVNKTLKNNSFQFNVEEIREYWKKNLTVLEAKNKVIQKFHFGENKK